MNIARFPGRNIDMMVCGLLDVLDGLTRLLSLGFCDDRGLCMSYLCWEKRIKWSYESRPQ